MPIWRDNNISVRLKVTPKHSLIFLYIQYACGSGIFTAELENLGCYERLLNISYQTWTITPEEVRRKIQAAIEEYGKFLTLFEEMETKNVLKE